MRSDYILYTLAVVFFVITAVSLVYVAGTLYVVSTAVLGLLMASAGFLLRPKAKEDAAYPPTPSTPKEPTESAPTQTAIMETPVAIVAKTETPLMESPKVEAPVVAEPAQAAQVSAPAASAPSASMTELTTIRGISAKRADQMKANGINSVEDLAKASASDLALKLEVSEKIVKMWIGSAKKIAK
jgi:predicted flap endonuclease-1-like 5' DNA nuclease